MTKQREKKEKEMKHRHNLHGGHADDEGEEVVDEGVDEAVAQELPRQVRHGLEVVVDEQLRRHQDEPERVHRARQRRDGLSR